MRKILSLFLSFVMIILTTTCTLIVNADENTSDKALENGEIHLQSNVCEQLEQIADIYTNRYIIKYNDDISDDEISSAYSAAENRSQQTINNIKEADEDDFNKMINSINSVSEDTDEVLISEDAQQVLLTFENDSDSGEINVSELSSDIKVVELPEKVDPDVFVQSLSSDLQDDIEYVQPDYKLELSDSDDTDALDDPQENIEATDSEPVEEEESNFPDANESNESENGTIDFDVVEISDNSTVEDAPSSALPEESVETEEPVEEEQETIDSISSESPTPEINEVENNEYLNLDTVYNLQDDIQSAWQITKGSGARVAVIDSKVDITHPDLVEHVTNSYDIVNDSELTYDENTSGQYYHGTHVTGIIASTVPEAEIIPIAAFEDGQAYTSDIIKAINYAKEQGAAIVNCSWGSTNNNQALKEAMQESGMLFVCAAGNNRMNVDETPIYPACYDIDNVISVTSLNQDLGFSYYSNYGEQIDIAMYGRNVYNAMPGGEYGEQSGTSMAAAYVTAGAAMAKAINADGNIKDVILNSAVSLSNLQDKVNSGRKLSYSNLVEGIVDGEIIEVTPEDDFDVNGYQRTPEENWELFGSLETLHIEAGGNNTAFIKGDGSLWMAGDNTYGQLGNGTYESSSVPVQVIGLSGIVDVSIGENHCIALDNAGHAYVWGNNQNNAVSYLSDNCINIPVGYLISNIVDIEAGTQTTFAISKRGSVYANGLNNYGQLGTGDKISVSIPTSVLSGVREVKSYGKHTFFIVGGITLMACGSNDHNVLNFNDSTGTILTPLSTGKFDKVDTGKNHTVVIDETEKAHSWGTNEWGQCGTGVDGKTYLDINNCIEVKCGKEHTAILLNNGTVMTWGYNNYGQIGNDSKEKQYTPYLIDDIANIVEIATGEHHTVALDKDGVVWCWGNNNYGQYGNGTTITSKSPIRTYAGSIVEQNATIGENHELYINNEGKIYAVGDNTYGQLGTGDNIKRDEPTEINGPWGNARIIKVETRNNTSFAITEDNVLYGWGQDDSRQLGNLEHANVNYPVQIATDVNDVRAGAEHTTILKTNGDVYVWGSNTYGQLGEEDYEDTPKKIYSGVKCICNGDYQTFLITDTNTLYATGKNDTGQLGLGNTTNKNDFTLVRMGVDSVSCGDSHTVIRGTDGKVYAFGNGADGQLGVVLENDETYSNIPVDIGIYADYVFAGGNSTAYIQSGKVYQSGKMNLLSSNIFNPIGNTLDIISIALGDEYALGTDSSGAIYRWGSMSTKINESYQSDINSIYYPYSITNVDAGRNQILAINGIGQVIAWGEGYYANGCDYMEIKNYPTVIEGIECASQVCRGKDHNLVLDTAGNVWGWGSNTGYPMGNQMDSEVKVATKIPNISNVKKVAAGEGFSIFLKNDGTLWGVGVNNFGQLGQGYMGEPIGSPVQIIADNNENLEFTNVSAGDDYVVAVTANKVYVWGNNDKYQLGNGTITPSSTPSSLKISAGSDGYFTDISAGTDACAVLTNKGALYTWGDYGEGDAFMGDIGEIKTPKLFLNGVSKVSVGKKHALAIKNDGTVYSWGYGYNDQLGYKEESRYFPPKNIINLNEKNISEIACGYDCSIAISSSGQMYTFGSKIAQRLYKGTLGTLSANAVVKYNYTLDISDIYSIRDSIETADAEKIYKFVPETSDTYIFTTVSDMNTVGYLYDSGGNQLMYNDDGNDNLDFKVVGSLQAGTTYYIKVKGYEETTGIYTLYIEKPFEASVY